MGKLKSPVFLETTEGSISIFEKGLELPTDYTVCCTVTQKEQDSLLVRLIEGEVNAGNIVRRWYSVSGVSSSEGEAPIIEITIHADADGDINCTARDYKSKRPLSVDGPRFPP